MVYLPHQRFTLRGVYGTVGAVIEDWQTSFAVTGAAPFADPDGMCLAVWNAFATNVMPVTSSIAVLRDCKVATIGADGRYETNEDGSYQGVGISVPATPSTGSGTGGGVYPLQVTPVATLDTSRPGPGGKGRLYLPVTSRALGASDRRLSVADAALIAASVRDFIDDVNDALETSLPDLPRRVIIASSKGFQTEVTQVRCGRVLDTQRSRRGKMLEEYQEAAVTP